MAIIKILYKMVILLACSIVQFVGVFTEGVSKLFRKFTDYLEVAHDWLLDQIRKKKKKKGMNINMPL